jgi:hypothetical protein
LGAEKGALGKKIIKKIKIFVEVPEIGHSAKQLLKK